MIPRKRLEINIGKTDNMFMMLDYLVPSHARKQLLKELWREGTEDSVSRLAERTSLSFAAAYEELKAMEVAGLATSERRGNAVVFRADRGHPQAKLLAELLKEMPPPGQDRRTDAVLTQLERMGAPVAVENLEVTRMSKEEALAEALKVSRRSASVARVFPVVLYAQWRSLDWKAFEALALKKGEKKALGFFLELTAYLSNEPKLGEMARRLRDRRFKKEESFFLPVRQGVFFKRLERRNTPPLARRWHFTMNMGLDSFASHFKKFSGK